MVNQVTLPWVECPEGQWAGAIKPPRLVQTGICLAVGGHVQCGPGQRVLSCASRARQEGAWLHPPTAVCAEPTAFTEKNLVVLHPHMGWATLQYNIK